MDSTTALQLVESLRSLASGGRAIITTIHQPSARLYGLLDKLLLLAEGRPLYYGKVRFIWYTRQTCVRMTAGHTAAAGGGAAAALRQGADHVAVVLSHLSLPHIEQI